MSMAESKHLTNPILPDDVFLADVEPHVFGDRVYYYGSHDIYGGKMLCEGDYEVWSAPLENPFCLRFDGISYHRSEDPYIASVLEHGHPNLFNCCLYAPDVVEMKGRYYLYYGVSMSLSGIGVAVSEKPEGPFHYLGRVRYPDTEKPAGWTDTEDGINDGDMAFLAGVPMIQLNPFRKHFGIHMKDYPYDPALLSDDGHLYLYFGVSYCYAAKLDTSDMRTVLKNPETGRYYSNPLLPSSNRKKDKRAIKNQDGWHMGNGASIRRIGNTYYLSYYAVNQNGCNAMCYSTSDSPLGPFQYQGVLISLGDGGPGKLPTAYGGNTHGGMFEVGGKYYQCYHRQTGDPKGGRQLCIAELKKRSDGTFQQAKYLTQIQADGGIPAKGTIPANTACVLTDRNGHTSQKSRPASKSPYFTLLHMNPCKPEKEGKKSRRKQVLTNLREGAAAGFKYFDFKGTESGKIALKIRASESNAAEAIRRIEIRQDSEAGPLIGVCSFKDCTPEKDITSCISFQGITGIHALYLIFHGFQKNDSFISISFS